MGEKLSRSRGKFSLRKFATEMFAASQRATEKFDKCVMEALIVNSFASIRFSESFYSIVHRRKRELKSYTTWQIFAHTQAPGKEQFSLPLSTRSILHHYQISTLTFRSRGEELTAKRGTGWEIIPLSYFLCAVHSQKKAPAAAKKLSDGKSVIRETRDDVIRISSWSWN